MTGLTLPKGLGTRHWAAAAITDVTKALAVVVSQSNGTVRLFQNGEVILRIAPMRHARAMKWQDAETEPARRSRCERKDRESARCPRRCRRGRSLLIELFYQLLDGLSPARSGEPARTRPRGLVLVADGVGGLDLCGTACAT